MDEEKQNILPFYFFLYFTIEAGNDFFICFSLKFDLTSYFDKNFEGQKQGNLNYAMDFSVNNKLNKGLSKSRQCS